MAENRGKSTGFEVVGPRILHLDGYKIANPTVLSRIPERWGWSSSSDAIMRSSTVLVGDEVSIQLGRRHPGAGLAATFRAEAGSGAQRLTRAGRARQRACLTVAVSDAAGHGLRASLLASLSCTAMRNARRAHCSIVQQVETALDGMGWVIAGGPLRTGWRVHHLVNPVVAGNR